MRFPGFLALLLLSNCASNTPFTPPVIDMAGVDQTKFNNDISECNRRREEGGFVQFGPVISNCTRDKGYRIIEYRS